LYHGDGAGARNCLHITVLELKTRLDARNTNCRERGAGAKSGAGGRGPRGDRVVGAVPHGHWQISTFVAGLRQDGLIAPLVLQGAIDGEMFLAYVHQFLAPALRPGDVSDYGQSRLP